MTIEHSIQGHGCHLLFYFNPTADHFVGIKRNSPSHPEKRYRHFFKATQLLHVWDLIGKTRDQKSHCYDIASDHPFFVESDLFFHRRIESNKSSADPDTGPNLQGEGISPAHRIRGGISQYQCASAADKDAQQIEITNCAVFQL